MDRRCAGPNDGRRRSPWSDRRRREAGDGARGGSVDGRRGSGRGSGRGSDFGRVIALRWRRGVARVAGRRARDGPCSVRGPGRPASEPSGFALLPASFNSRHGRKTGGFAASSRETLRQAGLGRAGGRSPDSPRRKGRRTPWASRAGASRRGSGRTRGAAPRRGLPRLRVRGVPDLRATGARGLGPASVWPARAAATRDAGGLGGGGAATPPRHADNNLPLRREGGGG